MMIGATIQHYQILDKIGQGGMGIVYKAFDTNLQRTVALKFLPEHLISTEIEKARFLREARAASAINHPNVCTIYDFKEHKGEQFIVMEYIEGVTLKDIAAAKDRLAVETVIDYAIQASAALAAAHAQGVLHRDIKSENIMVTPRGQIKVMDFGLALVKGAQRLTQSSSTAGTIAYMSPEQIEGKTVDARSDIFSFGVVFYELLTGSLPFQGENQAAVMHAIISLSPMPVKTWREIPSNILTLILRTLEKKVEKRSQSFLEIHKELLQIHAAEAEEKPGSKRRPILTSQGFRTSTGLARIFTVAALLIVISIASIFLSKLTHEKPGAPMSIMPFATELGLAEGPAFSPDANQIAYHWRPANSSQADIYIQQISSNQRLRLTHHPDDDVWPAWSPDGQYIAFCRQSNNRLEKGIFIMSSFGGSERNVYPAICQHPCWSPDGKSLVFANWEDGCVTLLDLKTGKSHKLSSPKTIRAGWWDASDPKFSPDGKSVAYIKTDTFGTSELCIVSLADSTTKKITNDNAMLSGLAWMPDGQNLIFSSARANSLKLWRIHRDGTRLKLLAASGQNSVSPAVSGNGRRLAFVEQRADNYEIGKIRINRKPAPQYPERVIATQRDETFLNISPIGKFFSFNSNRSGYFEIWKCCSDGDNLQQLTQLKTHSGTPRWSPDGTKIAFDTRPNGNSDIYVVSAEGGMPVRMTFDAREEFVPTWSNDGKWIYYGLIEQNESQVWKVPSGGGAPVQVTQYGGQQAMESPDGHVLCFTKKGGGFLWQCDLDGNNEIKLFPIMGDWRDWTVQKDGIYFFQTSSANNLIHACRYSFKNGRIEELATLNRMADLFNPAPSLDRKWLYVSYMEHLPQSEIILVENFQ